jgi:hypothetical protein
MKTVTGGLLKNMAAAKGAETAVVNDLKKIHKLASKRADLIVAQIVKMQAKADKAGDPKKSEYEEAIEKLLTIKQSMVATMEYAAGLVQQTTGETLLVKPIKRHKARDHKGVFTRHGSVAHLFRKILGKKD